MNEKETPMDRFREIVKLGGTIVVSPAMYDAILKNSEAVAVLGGVPIIANPHVPPAMIYAISRAR